MKLKENFYGNTANKGLAPFSAFIKIHSLMVTGSKRQC